MLMKTIRFFFLFAILGLAFSSCKNDDLCVADPIENCACEKIYYPVCGCDYVTYDNACEADCNGIQVIYEGPCR